MVYMTNNTIQIFQGHEVEVFELNGVVLFNPYHVGKCLDITDVKSSIRNFNDRQVVKVKNSDVRSMHFRKLNNTGENFLTESGVYKLIFKSRKPNAEAFTDWVTDEVLPSIRKTGGYQIPKTAGEQIKLLAQGYQELEQRVDQHEEKIDAIIKRLDVVGAYDNEWMLAKIRQATSSHVMQLTANQTYRTLWARYFYVGIYKMLKSIYRVSSIKSIPSEALEDVLNLIHTWKPSFTFIDQRVQEMEEKQKKNLLSDKKVIAFLQYMQLTNNGAINPWQ
jgi:putative phage-related regulatory protein